ncbi:MAG TPA: hypothetical protein ENI92_02120 [Bacteroidetes bacterium]|nr:hypothetical protein [Bacteroidota bacterium]
MVDRISTVYKAGAIQPPKPPEKSEKGERAEAPASSRTPAARLVPDLKDKVEISDKAREAARMQGLTNEPVVPQQDVEAIRSGWYAAGYKQALQSLSEQG